MNVADLNITLKICLSVCGFLFGTAALAKCPVEWDSFTSCQIQGRNTEVFVCFDDSVATYRYGPIDGPAELVLSDTVSHVDYEPWSGLGKAISETVTFYNGDFSYEVGGGFDRPFSEEEMALGPRRFGWIDVRHNGRTIGRLECIPDTVTYGFGGGIHDIKVAAGQDWDYDSKTWVSDAGNQPPILFDDTGDGCFVATEFMLGGVAMADGLSTLGKLGSPEFSGKYLPDGRAVDQVNALGLVVDIVDNIVAAMTATEALWNMPSGVRVGLTRGEVIAIMGGVPRGAQPDADAFDVLVCSEAPQDIANWKATISFGHDKRVKSISFVTLFQ